ncbi:MAG: hypothetical protein AAGM67_14705, partial [Bacteroidota bacterium]
NGTDRSGTNSQIDYGVGFNPPNTETGYPNFNSGNSNFSESPYLGNNNGNNAAGNNIFEFSEPEPPSFEPENISRTGQTYGREDIQVGRQTDQSLRILQVQYSETATTVTLEIQSVGDEPFPISLAPVGSKEAFYLTDQSMRKVARLKNVRALAGWPKRPYNLQVRERKVIALEFERLPDEITIFHLLEGSTNRPYSWDFYDVELIE